MRSTRPRRSALYMPGSNERALGKARELPCDVIIMDLEDGVAESAKDEARARIVSTMTQSMRARKFRRRPIAGSAAVPAARQ